MSSKNSRFFQPNPALTHGFDKVSYGDSESMTMIGTVHKTGLLLAVLVAAAVPGWSMATSDIGIALVIAAALVAFGVGLATTFAPRLAPKTALVYAVLEGLVVGGVSRIYEGLYDGIVIMAAGLTIAIFAALLVIYRTGVIKVTANVRLGITAATAGVALYYLVDLVASSFGANMPLINSASPAGIVFSLLVVALAAGNLVLDFDFIERGVDERAPAYMEWFGAFGLMVTVIWLYFELLRLLSKLRR